MMYRKLFVLLSVLWLGQMLRAEEVEFDFVCQPYLQQVSDTEVTIVWATNKPAVSWVEIAPNDSLNFYATERPQFFDTNFGRKKIGTLHKVRITGLSPATTYRYRIYSQEVLHQEERNMRYGRTIANNIHKKKPYLFSTLNPDKEVLHFAVINDIHAKTERYTRLVQAIDSASLDFMILNGDMVDKMNSLEQMYDGFINTSSQLFAKNKPFFMVRGNHETRGNCSEEYINLFPTNTGQPYYSFTFGSVYFLVLDGGEDKPDSDIEYSNLADFDRYRTEEAAWLKEQIASEEYKNATTRIVLIHVPPFGNSWHGPLEVQNKFIPLLNEANVDLMLCGHIHRHEFFEAGKTLCQFPVLINSNKHVFDIKVSNTGIQVDMINEQGNIEKQYKFNSKGNK